MFKNLLILISLFASYGLHSCTAFHLKSVDGAQIYCRSMEFGFHLDSNLLITPRNMSFTGTAPNNTTGLKWANKYGYVGMNVVFAKNLVCDGINEQGLVVGMLYLPLYAEYQKSDPAKKDITIGSWEVATYLLGNCSTIKEAKEALGKIIVAEEPFPSSVAPVEYLPLHYYITDKSGDVLIVEYINGTMITYDNPVKVLTNSPPFDWQLINLKNYVKMSPLNAPDLQLANLEVQGTGEGTGLLGLPGDYSPPSRFIKATFFSQWATAQRDALDTIHLGFQILNTFDIFEGIIKAPKKGKIETADFTQWTTAFDTTNLKAFFRGDNSLKIQMVDLTKIDFSKPEYRVVLMDKQFSYVDDTNNTQPLK